MAAYLRSHNPEIPCVPRLTAAGPKLAMYPGCCVVQRLWAVVTMSVGCLVKQNWKEEQRQLKATCHPGSEHRLVAKRGALPYCSLHWVKQEAVRHRAVCCAGAVQRARLHRQIFLNLKQTQFLVLFAKASGNAWGDCSGPPASVSSHLPPSAAPRSQRSDALMRTLLPDHLHPDSQQLKSSLAHESPHHLLIHLGLNPRAHRNYS